MPRGFSLQTNFTSGVLDPRLLSRVDIKHYYQGVAEGTNVVALPQGGLKRRPGMEYIAAISGIARVISFAFNTEQEYVFVLTDQNLAVYYNDTFAVNVTTPWLEADLFELSFTQSADTMIIVHEDYAPRKLVRGGGHTSWTLSTITFDNAIAYDFDDDYSAINFTPGATSGSTTLTASAAIFASGDVGGMFRGNDGIARITGFTSSTVVNIEVLENFADVTAISGDKAWLGEPIWSSTRGYPRSVTFHEGRLWFGGTRDKPQSLLGSVTNDFFNFDEGTALDDEAIFVTLDTDQVNAITALFSGRQLQVFTTGGEFYIPDSPITPQNIAVPRQSSFGSFGNLKPILGDGATIFIDRTGKSVREFIYSFVDEKYNATSVSLLAPHLITSPVDMAAQRGTTIDEANYIYIVNSDGTMAVFNTLRAQEVAAWTKWETTGEIESVTVVDFDVYFVVKRTINSVEVRHLEKANYDFYTDAGVQVTNSPASTSVAGLAHLNGESCRVRADDAVVNDATPSSGSITLTKAASDIEVGLGFTVTITTMPANSARQDGHTLTRKKRIVRAIFNIYESLGLYVDGDNIPDKQFGNIVIGNASTGYTGLREVSLLGWKDLAQITVTQPDPLPMTLLGIDLEVSA